MAGDRLGVDVIFNDGEDKPYEYEEGCDLVVQSEHQTVRHNRVFGEPLDDTLQDRQLVPQVGPHHAGSVLLGASDLTEPAVSQLLPGPDTERAIQVWKLLSSGFYFSLLLENVYNF